MNTDMIQLLRDHSDTAQWLEQIEATGAPPFPVVLPSSDDLPSLLLDLAVPHEDIDELVALLPIVERSPELRWLLERSVHMLVRAMGSLDDVPLFPTLPPAVGVAHRFFFVYVFLAMLPHIKAFHEAHGIPERVARRTLADLGRNIAVHRRRYGEGGLCTAFWLRLHFRGAIYDLGRLQFERTRLRQSMGQAVQAAGLPCGPGDPTLSIHIPAFSGPMTPQACDASCALAPAFFARHFPAEQYRTAVCSSWLLDEQLAEYLPADSNIVRFQRRFQPVHRGTEIQDAAIVLFVFGRPTIMLDELPQRTVLERAVVDHLRSGRHWYGGAGWFAL